MSLGGELSGSDVFLWVLDLDKAQWLIVGGQVSLSTTFNTAPIDITNKNSGDFRDLLEGQGLLSADITAEFVFSSDESFEYIKAAAAAKSIEQFLVTNGDLSNTAKLMMMVTAFAETANMAQAVTASVSFQSTDEIEAAISFEPFHVTPEGQFMVTPASGTPEPFYVREPAP